MVNTMISVLYVDDEPGLLEIARLFLERSGEFSVKTLTSAQEALDSPSLRSYDAIISDYQMPGMNGIDFLKRVRERFGDIPFILFTGRGREEIVIEAINNGADFYIQKGGDPQAQFAELTHKIRQAVRRKQAERSLHDSERRLSDIIDFLPDATLAIDRSGHVIAWNHAIEEMTGIAAGDMLGKGNFEYALAFYGSRRPILIDLIDEQDDKIAQLYSNIYRTGNSLAAETDIPRPKGHRISALLKAGPLYNQAGEITGAIESIRDITELKKTYLELRAAYEQVTATEEELRSNYDDLQTTNKQLTAAKQELRSQFNQLAESERTLRTNEERLTMAQAVGHTGSWEYDPATEMIWGSANGLHIFGYPAVAGVFPITDIEACIPERKRIHQALVDLIDQGKEYNLEYTINPADGSAPKEIHSFARFEKGGGGHPAKVIGVIHDITERKKAEDALRKSERKFRGMAERSSDLIFIIDNGMSPTYISPSARSIIGYEPEELVGKPPDFAIATIFKESGPELMNSVQANMKGLPVDNVEIQIRKKDGAAVYVNLHAVPIMQEDTVVGIQVTMRDITAAKKSETALYERDEQLRLLFENMIEGMALHEIICDSHGQVSDYRILGVNSSFERQLGISRTSVIGKTSREAYGVAEPPYLECYARVATTGKPELFETSFAPMDKYFRISVYSPQKNQFATVFSDISEQKRAEDAFRKKSTDLETAYEQLTATEEELRQNYDNLQRKEQALRESEEQFRALVETSPGMIWEIDLRGKFRYVSPSSESIMGYTPDELVGKTILDLIPKQGMAFALQELERIVSSKGPYLPFEFTARHRDGRDLVIEIRPSRVTDPDGKLIGLRGVIIDVTERKRAEDALLRANRQLSLLGSITRHDILNKISVILGFIKITETKWNDPALAEYLGKIKSATTAIRSQIEFTRLYQSLGTHEPQWIALDTAMPRLQAPATMTLHTDVRQIQVFADPMLEKVFTNLLDNSIRHGQRVTEIRVSSRNEGDDLIVVWEDNGIGIAADEKERIFERGFGKNTGLGMFLVREILSLTGITIKETGEPSTGARFEISVPKGAYRDAVQK